MNRIVVIAAAAGLAQGQPAAVTITGITESDGAATVAFTPNDVSGSAQSFVVRATTVPLFTARDPTYFWGERTGPNALVAASNVAGNVLDTTRWTALVSLGGSSCPLSLGTTGATCFTAGSTVVTANRVTTLTAQFGHQFDLQTWWRWPQGGIVGAPDLRNGVPMLVPRVDLNGPPFALRTTPTRWEAEISAFPIDYNWSRYSWSGFVVYDVEPGVGGRMKPIYKTGLYEWLGRFETWYPRCTGVPSATSTCTWTSAGTFGVGSSNAAPYPTPQQPWKFILDYDPIAQTIAPKHVHPTFGQWNGAAFSLRPADLATNLGDYWTSYMNTTQFGVYNISRLRVALFTECNGGATYPNWAITVQRFTVFEYPIPFSTRILYGNTTGVNGVVAEGAGDTVLDTSRYVSLVQPPQVASSPNNCPFATSTFACTTLGGSSIQVVNRVAQITARHGHQWLMGPFMTQLLSPTGVTAPGRVSNGVPVLGLDMPSVYSLQEPHVITVEMSAWSQAYTWSRFTWQGLVLYDLDNAGNVRPLMKTGLYEFLGYFAMWVPNCNVNTPTSCTWTLVGSTSTIGGSSTTAPTPSNPWRFSLLRNPVLGTWQATHTHPTVGQWNGPTFSEGAMSSLLGAYWTNYVNNATFNTHNPGNTFDFSKIRVGVFMESNGGAALPFQTMSIQRAYVESTVEAVIAQNAETYSALRFAGIQANTPCAPASALAVNVTRAAACGSPTGTTCSVTIGIPMTGINTTVSVTPAIGGSRGTETVSPQLVLGYPTLPVPGAQLWLDANSLPSWAGATPSTAVPCTTANGDCRPMVWWPDVSGNNYLFSQAANAGARPFTKTWSVAEPFQSVVFDGTNDVVRLDESMLGRDTDFDLHLPGQSGYDVKKDTEMTWFLLYKPAETTDYFVSRTAFSKGAPGRTNAGSSYGWYTQRYTYVSATPYFGYDQMHGAWVAGDNQRGVGTLVGQRWYQTRTPGAGYDYTPYPHAQRSTLLSMTHYRNASIGGTDPNRQFALHVCEGLVRGDLLSDRCSNSGGMSPADRWVTAETPDSLGLDTNTLVRQANLAAGAPPGSNVADYAAAGYGAGTALPRTNGLFAVGGQYLGGQEVNSYFRGQIQALVMYRKSLTLAERQQVSEYLLQRYGQLCPAIPAPAGSTGGCPAGAPGSTCSMSCNQGAAPPQIRTAGNAVLTCNNGRWSGKALVCGASCAARSSPQDFAACTQRYSMYDFSDTAAFPTNTATAFSSLLQLETFQPTTLPADILNRAWSVDSANGARMLIGRPIVPVGCSPVTTGPISLMENNPSYLDKVSPGAPMVVEAGVRLLSDGTQAGVGARMTAAGSGYRAMVGRATAGNNIAVTLEKWVAGASTVLTTTSLSNLGANWDLTGATTYTLHMTVNRDPASADITAQIIRVDLVGMGNTLSIFNFADSTNGLALGGAGVVVASGRAGFLSLAVMGDCDGQGAMCQLSQGQSCSWTCGVGTAPRVGGVAPVGTYWETCSSGGTMPLPSAQLLCVPLPPSVQAVRLNISEAAPVGSTVGFVRATAINPRHIPLFSVLPLDNSETIFDVRGTTQGIVDQVFAVSSCSGEVILNRGGALSFDRFPRSKQTFNLIVQACTNGNPLSCTNASLIIDILNAPSAPYFLEDTDVANGARMTDPTWLRTMPENAVVGTAVWNADGTSAAGLPITAISPESTALRYDIAFGNIGGAWMIDQNTGQIRLAALQIDFETLPTYNLVVRARDSTNLALETSVTVRINVLDRNDAPTAVSPQYLPIAQGDAEFAQAPIGQLQVVDPDVNEAFTVTWVGTAPARVSFNATGTSIRVFFTTARVYPSVEESPVIFWRNQVVREVLRGTLRVADRSGAAINVAFEVGVTGVWQPSADPSITAFGIPNALGLNTRGTETITFLGSNFLAIRNSYGGIVNITLNSQANDDYPNRTYVCTNARVVNDGQLTCSAPHAWGSNLVIQVTYGVTRRNMASTVPLVVSYAAPVVSASTASLGGRASFPNDLTLGVRDSLPTNGGMILLLSVQNLGIQADAAKLVRLEFGQPIPNDPYNRLEYTATYVPCPLYEVWASPTNLAGKAPENNGQSRICVRMPPGVGSTHRYQVRVGTVLSALSGPDPLNAGFAGWLISYTGPTLSRVWRPVDAAGNPPAFWNTAAQVGTYPTSGGGIIYLNGTNIAAVGPGYVRIPAVTWWVWNIRVAWDQGRQTPIELNFTSMPRADGTPDCWLPSPLPWGSSNGNNTNVVACRIPPGVSSGIRIRLQVGDRVIQSGNIWEAYGYNAPAITSVTGPGTRNANTEGGQTVTLFGTDFGPTADRFAQAITNYYGPKPWGVNPATWTYVPLSVFYGPITGEEYLATGCQIVSESPATVTCLSAPGAGRNFRYRISVGGQNFTTVVQTGTGYSPPLISSVSRAPEDQVFDPVLGAVPGPSDYMGSGGESLVINGQNLGPCPITGCNFLERNPAYFRAEYYTALADNRVVYGGVIGDASKRIWYNASSCNMTIPHRQVVCRTTAGAGSDAVVRLFVAGQQSVLPSTSFALPLFTSFSFRRFRDNVVIPEAHTDGTDWLVITGRNFGPRENCQVIAGNTRCRGLIQDITYGPTGREYRFTDWNLPSVSCTVTPPIVCGHNRVDIQMGPGIGKNHRVIMKVADQESLVSTMTFSYQSPTVQGVSPSAGVPTVSSEINPTVINVTGINFGNMNDFADLWVMFGNPEDGTLVERVPIIARYPDRTDATETAAYLLQNVPRQEWVTFHLPPGAGKRRAVRLVGVDTTVSGALPVVSSPAFIDYADPVVTTVVVEAVPLYIGNNDTVGTSPEFDFANVNFGGYELGELRLLTLQGQYFGADGMNSVGRLVEVADFNTPNTTAEDVEWSASDVMDAPAMVFSWSDDKIVLMTYLDSAYVRVRLVSAAFNPPINNATGLPERVVFNQYSNAYRYAEMSPAIGNIMGNAGPYNTAGGDVLAFTVKNLLTATSAVSVTVTASGQSRPCPLLYAPEDTARGPTQVVSPANVLAHLVRNSDGGAFKYFDTPAAQVDSTWTLYCRLPEGEGAAATLQVSRDGILSGTLRVRYASPVVSMVEIQRGDGSWTQQPYTSGMVVTSPTLGTRFRIHGTHFGVCPGVFFSTINRVNIELPGCNASRTVQAGSTASLVYASGQSVIEVTSAKYQGTAWTFAVVAGDQDSRSAGSSQAMTLNYYPPTVLTATATGPTVGGTTITVTGTDFGTLTPSIRIGATACASVVRPAGDAGHSSLTCRLPVGSGKNLDVSVIASAQTGVLSRGFSYLPPTIELVHVQNLVNGTWEGVTYNLTDPDTYPGSITAPTTGGYKVILEGDNFGVAAYTRHCMFVSWRGRDRSRSFVCNGVEDFVGEGEIPRLALEEYAPVNTTTIDWSHNRISFMFPPGIGLREIIPYVNGNTPVVPLVFRYEAPNITADLYPNRGPTVGGTPLSIVGTGFGTAAIDTSTPAGRALIVNRPIARTRAEYLSWAMSPQAAVVVTFGRGCVTNYVTASGGVPEYLRACERGSISLHSDSEVGFLSAGGVGVNREVKITVYDQQPSAQDSNVLEVVAIHSNSVFFSYDAPVALLANPRPLKMTDVDGGVFYLSGVNFGSLELAQLQGWTEAEQAVNMTINAVAALKTERLVSTQAGGVRIDQLKITVPNLPVGYHNLTYQVAGQLGFTPASPPSRASLIVSCEPGTKIDFRTEDMGPFGGFFGRPGETCAPCPTGAICLGFDDRFGPRAVVDRGTHMYPIPVIGFYNLNSSDSLTTGMYDACPAEVRGQYPGRDTCVVRCDPPEACLGANQCAPEYVSKAPYYRCASCAPGYYKRATVCVKCPDSPWALVIGFALLVIVGGGVAYSLNRMRINIAYIAIAIDYFQVLAIFAQSKVQWPAALQELFHVLSAFNLNIEIVAPECIVPDLGFQRKWSFVMAFPLALQVFFAMITLSNMLYKQVVKGQKQRLNQVGGAIMASVLMVMYVMYIYLTRNILDIYNCRPTDPPDGKRYMVAVFEECGKPGGVQLTLLPAAIVATIVYIIGYPAGVGYLLYKERELVMEDQLLRAKGQGDDRSSNPHAYEFRKRWGRLYYQFKPDSALWILVIILRKFLIAATFVLFNTQPAFQLAAVFLVLFLAYSAQMRFSPYLSPQDFDLVLKEHEKLSLTDATHARLRATLSGIASRNSRKGMRKNQMLSSDGQVDAKALLGVLQGWLFNYNTVEQLMLFSAGIVCVMGMMFAAQQRKSSTYRESRDAITSVVIAVVALSILYLFTVFVTEVTVLAGEANRKKVAASTAKAADSKRAAAGGKKAPGDTSSFEVGDVTAATNPMFLGKQQGGAGAAAAALSGDDAQSAAASYGEGMDAAAAIEAMRDPPASKELWLIYKEKYEELAETVESLRAQIDSAPVSVRSKAGGATAKTA